MSDYQTDWLDEIELRLVDATPGPWTACTTGVAGGDHWYICDRGESIAHISANDGVNEDQRQPDAEFIAHSREDVERLVSEVRRYRDEQNPNQAAKYWAEILKLRREMAEQFEKITAVERQIDTWMSRKSKYTAEVELAVGLFGDGIRKILRGES